MRGSPKLSFSVKRCPLAKSAAEMRLRPSSCTSSSSSAPVAAGHHQRLHADEARPAPPVAARHRARGLPDVQRLAAESWSARRARAAGRAPDCGWPSAGCVQSIAPSSFFSSGARWPARRPAFPGRCVPAAQARQRLHQQVRAHHGQAPAQFDGVLLGADLGLRLQQHVAGIEPGIDPHRGDAGARLAVARSPTESGPAPRYFGSSEACTLMMPSGARSITDLRNDLAVAHHHHGVGARCRADTPPLRDGARAPAGRPARPRRSAASFTGEAAGILAAAARPVGLRQHRGHLVPGARRSASSVGTANAGVPRKTRRIGRALAPVPGALQLLDLALHQVALQRADVGDVEPAVEVIGLVQERARQQIFAGLLELLALRVLRADR